MATSTATGSMSPSQTLRFNALAAAMARTPAPQPTSRTLRGRRRLSTRSKCSRQPRVVPWWPVPKARPASISTPTSPARSAARSWAPWTRKRPARTGFKPASALATQSRFSVRPNSTRGGRLRPRRDGDEFAQRRLVGREAEIGFDQPRLAAARPGLVGLESGRSGLGRLEALDDQVGDGASALFVADEAQLMRGVVGGQAFEHDDPRCPLLPLREKVALASARVG